MKNYKLILVVFTVLAAATQQTKAAAAAPEESLFQPDTRKEDFWQLLVAIKDRCSTIETEHTTIMAERALLQNQEQLLKEKIIKSLEYPPADFSGTFQEYVHQLDNEYRNICRGQVVLFERSQLLAQTIGFLIRNEVTSIKRLAQQLQQDQFITTTPGFNLLLEQALGEDARIFLTFVTQLPATLFNS